MILMDDSKSQKMIEEGTPNFETLQIMLKRYCLSLTESPWDAEDLAQDTWLKVVSALTDMDHRNLEAYMLRIAKNIWIDRTRRAKVLNRIMKAEQPRMTPPDHGILEIEAAFHALINHLSPLQRAVFLLRDVFGYSSTESAVMLATTEGAVKAALHRARQALPLVKDTLDNDALPQPEDEGLSAYLSMVAASYHIGDVTALITLVQRNEIEPVAAMVLLHNQRLRNQQHRNIQRDNVPSTRRRAMHQTAQPSMSLAA